MPPLNPKLMKAMGKVYVYEPHGAARDLFHHQDDEVLLAGPKGTGKSLGCIHKAHLMLSKHKGSKGLMCRKTRQSMTDSCIDMYKRFVLKPEDKVQQHKQEQHFMYPNTSMLAYAGLDEPQKLQSSEWDFIYVQEATELTENDWEMLTGLLRHGVIPYQQLMADCNPSFPNHWLKKRCDNGKTVMLLSKHQDNPKYWDIKKNRPTLLGQKYFGKLANLTGHRLARLYKGQWAAAEGLVYESYDPNIHLINRADLPKNHREWRHVWGIDFGYVHPTSISDYIINPKTNQIIRNAQFYHTETLTEDAARFMKEQARGLYVPSAILADHDAEDRKTFERHSGFLTLPAYKAIQRGVEAVQARLKKDWCPEGPGILFVRDSLYKVDQSLKEAGLPTCTEEEMECYVWPEKEKMREHNTKKDELPVDKDNHGLDELRYVVAFEDSIADDPQEFEDIFELGEDEIISRY